ncbi:MAG: YARHG domain-containing protein [Clostridiales bacterium]|nr:YARHG domain-containing protein [Clostridiales bacterium]
MSKKARAVDARVNPLYPDRIESNAMGVLLAVISVIVAIILLVMIVSNFSYAAHPKRVSGYTGVTDTSTDTVGVYEEDTGMEEIDAAEEIDDASGEEIDAAQSEELMEESVESDVADDEAVAEETVEEADSAEETAKYIIADSDSRYLTTEDLEGLTAEELRIARNEIYARHGRMFDDEALQEYFNSKEWYTGTIAPEDFTESMLNDYERENAYTISAYETEMGYRQ